MPATDESGVMVNLRQLFRGLVCGTLGLLVGGCGRAHLVQREVLALSGGGAGESWIVVHEVEGDEGREHADDNRYVVYQCVPTGCRGVGTLAGSERIVRRR